MSNIAIITARGGSKRIPRKNIKDFLGKPIMAYSIEAAIESSLFSEVMVSTDDAEIAEIAVRYGAKVPFFRSPETSNDFAGTMDVLREVVGEYEKRGMFFDHICCIYPCAPFVTPEKIAKGLDLLVSEKADYVIPVSKFSNPPQWGLFIRDGRLVPVLDTKVMRSQDFEPIYCDCGQFYWHSRAHMDVGTTANVTVPLVVSDLETQDIDNIEDWKIAEIKYQLMKGMI